MPTRPTTHTTLIDIAGAAEQLGVSVRYLRRLVSQRRIPYVKLGHYVRFDPVEIDELIDRARVGNLDNPDALPRR